MLAVGAGVSIAGVVVWEYISIVLGSLRTGGLWLS